MLLIAVMAGLTPLWLIYRVNWPNEFEFGIAAPGTAARVKWPSMFAEGEAITVGISGSDATGKHSQLIDRSRRLSGPAAVASATFIAYATLAIRLHRQFHTGGYDLGIFTQYAKAFSHLDPPTSPLLAKGQALSQSGPHLFGDHFSPILILLGPIYRVWPHAETLLVVQAGLVAISAFAVTRAATRHLGTRSGLSIGVAYATSWGIQQLVDFDFHEVAFELPILSTALVAFIDGRWRSAAAWCMPLLLVKEDMGITVALFGFLLVRHSRRTGLVVIVVAAVATSLAVLVVIPHYAPSGLGRLGAGTDQGGGYGALISEPWTVAAKLVWPPVKVITVLMVLLPTLFLAIRSPLIWLIVPTLLWRFTASTPNYWGLSWHYSAVLMPIAFLALVDSLKRMEFRPWRAPYATKISVRAPAYVLAIALIMCTLFPLRLLATPSLWQTSDQASAAAAAVKMVPDGELVAATNDISPHLVDEDTVYPLAGIPIIDDLPHRIDWVVADQTLPDLRAPAGIALMETLSAEGFQTLFDRHGIVVLHRG